MHPYNEETLHCYQLTLKYSLRHEYRGSIASLWQVQIKIKYEYS